MQQELLNYLKWHFKTWLAFFLNRFLFQNTFAYGSKKAYTVPMLAQLQIKYLRRREGQGQVLSP